MSTIVVTPPAAAALVAVSVDQAGRDDEIADVQHAGQRHALGHDRLDPFAGDQHRAGRDAVGADDAPAADAAEAVALRHFWRDCIPGSARHPARRGAARRPGRYTWPWRWPSS
jgi:hypothetical protein